MITDVKINEEAKERYYRAGFWTADTLVDAWSRAVAAHPDKPYVKDDQGSTYTYRECDDGAARIAAWLNDIGVKPGDVVTFQLPTWAEFCPVFLGIAMAGAVMHPVARNYSVEDLSFVMSRVGSRAFICPTRHRRTDHEAQARACLERVDTLAAERILLVDKKAHAAAGSFAILSEVLKRYEPRRERPAVSADDIACILSTSGTTGKPKQALLTHNNILFSERVFAEGLHRTADDVMFMPSPLNHATGFFHGLVAPFVLGGTTVLQQDFDADEAVEIINREQATWSMGATPFIHDIVQSLEANGTSVPTLKLFLSGGAPLPRSLVGRARAQNMLLCECYGSTESCPHAYVPPERCTEWDGAWSGVALPGIEVRIVDRRHREVPRGAQGEEASRGPHVFVGYLGEPSQTALVLDDEGWFYSGDLGIMDEQGRLRINGRKKDIVIRGGENISACEVDEAVEGWQDIVDHATIGVPDDRMGERICLFAVPKPGLGHEPCLGDLVEYLRRKGVSKRLWPERLEPIDAIPRTCSGKARRYRLADVLAERLAEARREEARKDEGHGEPRV